MIVGSLVFVWSRFIERNLIVVNEHNLDLGWNARVVLIADMHLGLFKGDDFMSKVVEKVNGIADVDAVLIAGDLTYYSNNFAEDFASFAKFNAPVYMVWGNHDAGFPGPDVRSELEPILANMGIQTITNQAVNMGSYTLLGLGSNWASNDKVELINNYSSKDNVLVLTHNPDTVSRFPSDANLPNMLTFVGHTHCGQVRIPWLYRSMIPTKGEYPYGGIYDLDSHGKLLVTCGLGEVGIPLRFLNPPEIVVVNL